MKKRFGQRKPVLVSGQTIFELISFKEAASNTQDFWHDHWKRFSVTAKAASETRFPEDRHFEPIAGVDGQVTFY